MSEEVTNEENNEEIVPADTSIPSGVVDVAAYKQYKDLQEHSIFDEKNRKIETSDEDLVIDLMAPAHVNLKKIKDLPETERDFIEKRIRAVLIIKNKITGFRNTAYGSKPKVTNRSTITSKILDENAAEIIEYFGRHFSYDEIRKFLQKSWGYSPTKDTLKKFEAKHNLAINKAKSDFIKDHSDIRLSHKKARLEELTEMYYSRKIKYETSQNKEDYKLMLQTLKLISDMIEGKQVTVGGQIDHKVEVKINYHIQQEVMKGLTVNDIIIARVASRIGVNPRVISTRLHQSIYSKHSGFQKPDGDLADQEIIYPSSMVYNWDDIKKIHKKKQAEDAEDAEWEEVTDDEAQDAQNIKAALLQRLANKKEDANNASKRVDDNTKGQEDSE